MLLSMHFLPSFRLFLKVLFWMDTFYPLWNECWCCCRCRSCWFAYFLKIYLLDFSSSYSWLVCLPPTAYLAGRKDCGKYQQLVLLILSFLPWLSMCSVCPLWTLWRVEGPHYLVESHYLHIKSYCCLAMSNNNTKFKADMIMEKHFHDWKLRVSRN